MRQLTGYSVRIIPTPVKQVLCLCPRGGDAQFLKPMAGENVSDARVIEPFEDQFGQYISASCVT